MNTMLRSILILIAMFALIDVAMAKFIPNSFVGDFYEIHKGSRGRVKKIPLKIKYLAKGNIYYESFDEDGLLQLAYVCNPDKTFKYNPPLFEDEKGELAIGDSNKFCYSKIFDSLSQGLKDNKLYKVKESKNLAIINFEKDAEKQLGLKKINITFKGNEKANIEDIKSMEFFLNQKPDPVLIEFKSVDTKQKLNKSLFKFQVPENTNVKEMN
jgi:outer membrane lipoprotein-sorting protein